MKVLISAYACEPDAGSEPGTGWAWARAAAEDHEVWLLTRANNAAAIEAELARSPVAIHPVYVDLPKWARFWKRGRRGIHLYYLLWQVLAYRRGRDLHADVTFDVGHHVTLATDWMPAGIAWIRGLPVVWGPVGGACPSPWWAVRWLGARGVVEEIAREAVTRPLRRTFGDATAARAAVVLAQNPDVARRFRRVPRLRLEPHVALADATIEALQPTGDNGKRHSSGCRALFVGRLLGWKGIHLAVDTLAEDAAQDWTLHVYGSGPESARVMARARRAGVADRVTMHGNVPRAEIFAAMRQGDALLFPTMHDSAPWAVAEALAAGLPVVCLDRGGPSVLVGDDDGVKVRPDREAPLALAAALQKSARKGRPQARWTAARLPDLLRSIYAEVVNEGAVPGDVTATAPHAEPPRRPPTPAPTADRPSATGSRSGDASR